MGPVDKLLTAKESSVILSISIATFWRRVRDGTLPAPIEIGHLRKWPESEIRAFIAAKGAKFA